MNEKTENLRTDEGIQEFVLTSKEGGSVRKKAAKARHTYAKKQRNERLKEVCSDRRMILLIVYGVCAAAAIIAGILGCKLAVVPVCCIVLIQTLLAVCLHNLPLWLHIAVVAAEVICGVIFGQLVMMLIAAALYAAAIAVLRFFTR